MHCGQATVLSAVIPEKRPHAREPGWGHGEPRATLTFAYDFRVKTRAVMMMVLMEKHKNV